MRGVLCRILYGEIGRVLASFRLCSVAFGALIGVFCTIVNAESARHHDEIVRLAAMVDSALENNVDSQADLAESNAMSSTKPSTESSPATRSTAPQEERVDIIDYKRNKIVGYMVLKNGNIIKQVMHKYPKDFQKAESSPAKSSDTSSMSAQTTPAQNPNTQNQGASNPTPSANQAQTTQDSYERQISSAPADNKKAAKTKESTKEAAKDTKKSAFDKTAKKSSKNMIQSEAIPQESGNEARATNQTYKNRQWDKKKIIHEVQTQVIDMGDAKK